MTRIILAEEFKEYEGFGQLTEWLRQKLDRFFPEYKDWTIEFRPLPPGEMPRTCKDEASKITTVWVRPGKLDLTNNSIIGQLWRMMDKYLDQHLADQREK